MWSLASGLLLHWSCKCTNCAATSHYAGLFESILRLYIHFVFDTLQHLQQASSTHGSPAVEKKG